MHGIRTPLAEIGLEGSLLILLQSQAQAAHHAVGQHYDTCVSTLVQFEVDHDLDLITYYAVGVLRAKVKITAFDCGCCR
jgi:hypothetical protein